MNKKPSKKIKIAAKDPLFVFNISSQSKHFMPNSIRTTGCSMQEMLKKATNTATRSRRLNTIMEIVESSDETNHDETKDSNNLDFCKTPIVTSQQCGKFPRNMSVHFLHSAIYGSPSERRIAFTHASPRHHTFSTAPSCWREGANVSITPAGVIRSASEPSPFKPRCGQDTSFSEVALFFPEFFKDDEILPMRTGQIEAQAVCNEVRKSLLEETTSKEDPLVQSWLSLFSS